MRKGRERQKRVEFVEKLKLLEREKNTEIVIKTNRDRDRVILQRRFKNRIRVIQEKEELQKTLNSWAHSGFGWGSPKKRRQISMSANNTVTDFQKSLILSVTKAGKKAEEGAKDSNKN